MLSRAPKSFLSGGLCRLKHCVDVVDGEIRQPIFRHAVEVRPDHRENTGNGFVVEVQDKYAIVQFTGKAAAKDTIRKD